MFKKVAGTRDILPAEVGIWHSLEHTSRAVFSRHNYHEIRPPLIEEANLFNRSLGEATEIVQKQMFLVEKADDVYALRPEGTASIVRAYLENSLDKTDSFVKFYYMGPMFRMERPQKGRYRQFHHIGVEAIGSTAPEIDIEVISLADALLKAYGIQGYELQVNSLGCTEDKKKLNQLLREGLKPKKAHLCQDCQSRYERNVLRILDCKHEVCRGIVNGLDIGASYLCPDCCGHFDTVKAGLSSLDVAFNVSDRLVRGLDYYTRTVFEIKHANLGPQQDALGAGGRYDGLVAELGGPQMGAVGFAFGVERLLLALGAQQEEAKPRFQNHNPQLVFVAPLGAEAKKESLKLLAELRVAGICADTDYEGKSLKGSMRRANDLGCRFVLILGDDELKEGCVMVKDMAAGTQEKVARGLIAAHVKI